MKRKSLFKRFTFIFVRTEDDCFSCCQKPELLFCLIFLIWKKKNFLLFGACRNGDSHRVFIFKPSADIFPRSRSRQLATPFMWRRLRRTPTSNKSSQLNRRRWCRCLKCPLSPPPIKYKCKVKWRPAVRLWCNKPAPGNHRRNATTMPKRSAASSSRIWSICRSGNRRRWRWT